MSLGNVPKRNHGREDKGIAKRLKQHAKVMQNLMADGMTNAAASKEAYRLIKLAEYLDQEIPKYGDGASRKQF